MDNSSQYIEMCEAAKVIQRQWKPDFGDFFVSRSLGLTSECHPIVSDLELKKSYLKTIKAVWLPRQDQLQELVIGNHATFWDLAIAFSNALMDPDAPYYEKLDSMEKLWLAYVMRTRYKSRWSDGKWLQ